MAKKPVSKFKATWTVSKTHVEKSVSPQRILKAIKLEKDPVQLDQDLVKANNGFIGGTIRDGSSDERFALGALTFDIQLAKEMCAGQPNDEVEVSPKWSEKINVDPQAAMRSKSQNPVLVAQLCVGGKTYPALIDGHHRMYKAVHTGEKTLPAYVFTPEQTISLIDTHPDMLEMLTKSAGISVEKGQPSSSSVHVPAPIGSEKDKVMKDKLTTEGRKHVAEHNFAIPETRKYPLVDISHARNALARVAQHGTEEEQKKVRAAVYRKYPSLEKRVGKAKAVDVDDDPDMYPGIDNLEGGILKAALGGSGENEFAGLYDMQQLVAGTDFEMEANGLDENAAKEMAQMNLETDPDFYRKKYLMAERSDDKLTKDTEETEADPFAGEGLNPQARGLWIDLGSGQCREAGHTGFDLYPYDSGTQVHDLNLGIPLPDESVSKVHMANAFEHMDLDDPKALLSEIHRVMMPGGQFVYQGPNEIYNYPSWQSDFPGLVLTDHEDSGVQKDGSKPVFKQTFTRLAVPDPATANDAEPRIGIRQFDQLPADALLAMDAIGYYWSDATSSGRGNRLYGYPSQGALLKNKGSKVVKIAKSDEYKQIVYGVVFPPDEEDLQGDFMTAEDIEEAAHRYMASRVIGSEHEEPMDATCVESFIAPCDFEANGQYGPQPVTKGSWIVAAKINDPAEWQKVVDGTYTGFSVGGFGLREET